MKVEKMGLPAAGKHGLERYWVLGEGAAAVVKRG